MLDFFKWWFNEFRWLGNALFSYFREWDCMIPPKNFEEWVLKYEDPNNSFKTNISALIKPPKNLDSEKDRNNIIKDLIQKAQQKPIILHIDQWAFGADFVLEFPQENRSRFNPAEINPNQLANLAALKLTCNPKLKVKNCVIGYVNLERGSHKIEFENCCVKQLIISKDAKVQLSLKKCLVGEIVTTTGSIMNLKVESGWICSWDAPSPDGENPFLGTVEFDNANFPTSKKSTKLFSGTQQYRNLRSHLEKLNNGPATGVIRAKELASEREGSAGFIWLYNWLYYIASDYGLKPGRPFAIVLFLYFIMFIVVVIWDGGVLKIPPEKLVGWEKVLANEDPNEDRQYARIKRSAILPLQAVINPFGGFRYNQIVIPATAEVKAILFIYGFLTDGFLLFFIFGLRKSFKIP